MILIKKNDLVISGINVSKGAVAVYEDKEDITATIHYSSYTYNEDIIDIEFLKIFLKSPEFLEALKEQVPGGIKTEIKPKHLLPLEVIIPNDVKIQRTIVDKYISQELKKNKLSKEIDEQQTYLTKLRQAFLTEAMQGKLVPQDPSDEPASELLKIIKAEKEKLIKEGKIKKQKPLPPIKSEDIPYKLPANWVWCRLDEISVKITDGEHQTPNRTNCGIKLLSAKNVRDGYLDFENIDFISKEDHIKISQRCNPENGDLLIVSVGATIGRSTIINTLEEFSIVRSVALIKLIRKQMNRFLKYVFDSPILQNEISNRSWGTAQPCLYLNQIKEINIPIPPLFEQKRIVEKLDKLMQKCDELEENIKNTKEHSEQLMEVLLKEALIPQE